MSWTLFSTFAKGVMYTGNVGKAVVVLLYLTPTQSNEIYSSTTNSVQASQQVWFRRWIEHSELFKAWPIYYIMNKGVRCPTADPLIRLEGLIRSHSDPPRTSFVTCIHPLSKHTCCQAPPLHSVFSVSQWAEPEPGQNRAEWSCLMSLALSFHSSQRWLDVSGTCQWSHVGSWAAWRSAACRSETFHCDPAWPRFQVWRVSLHSLLLQPSERP